MKKTYIIKRVVILTFLIFAMIAFIFIARNLSHRNAPTSFTLANKGNFEIYVSATGELLSERSTDIRGPMLQTETLRGRRSRGRSIRSMNLKILDIVPEGTIVDKGDYIAQLDRTNYENILKEELDRLKSMHSTLDMKLIDTAVTLNNLQNEIKNQAFAVEVASATLKQLKFEPPATIRKAERALDKEKRSLNQKKKIYNLKLIRVTKEINNIKLNITSETRLVNDLNTYLDGFTIRSPSQGMVIYKRNRNGTKRKTGSTINPFDMVIAALPDLSSMISKTYISEIDISKIDTGQLVNIRVDAFADKSFTGKVISIAQIGERLPNSDTKVFEVMCRVDTYDPALRPSMTTNNKIIIKSFANVIYVPLEIVQTDTEGFSYVITRSKTKQVVMLGESNDKFIIIDKGLEPGTEIYITPPADSWRFKISAESLLTEADQSQK